MGTKGMRLHGVTSQGTAPLTSGLCMYNLPTSFKIIWALCCLVWPFYATCPVFRLMVPVQHGSISGPSRNVYFYVYYLWLLGSLQMCMFLGSVSLLRKRSTVFRVKKISFAWLRVLEVVHSWIKEPMQNMIPRPHQFKQFGQVQGPLYLFHKVAIFVAGRGKEETR